MRVDEKCEVPVVSSLYVHVRLGDSEYVVELLLGREGCCLFNDCGEVESFGE